MRGGVSVALSDALVAASWLIVIVAILTYLYFFWLIIRWLKWLR